MALTQEGHLDAQLPGTAKERLTESMMTEELPEILAEAETEAEAEPEVDVEEAPAEKEDEQIAPLAVGEEGASTVQEEPVKVQEAEEQEVKESEKDAELPETPPKLSDVDASILAQLDESAAENLRYRTLLEQMQTQVQPQLATPVPVQVVPPVSPASVDLRETTPKQALPPPPSQQSSWPPQQPQTDQDYFDYATQSPQALNQLLTHISQQTAQQTAQQVMQQARSEMVQREQQLRRDLANEQVARSVFETFMDAKQNEDLKPVVNILRRTAVDLQPQHPEWTTVQLLQEAAKDVRKIPVKMTRVVAAGRKPAIAVPVRGSAARVAPKPSDDEIEEAAMRNCLPQLRQAEELDPPLK